MRVVNLSQRPEPIGLEVVQSAAAELLMSIMAMGDLLGLTKDVNTYDMGKERLEELRNKASGDLLKDIEKLFGGPGTLGVTCGKLLAYLVGYVLEAGPKYDVDAFLGNLENSEPTQVVLALVGYHSREHQPVDADVVRRAVEGDPGARADFLELARARWGESDGLVVSLEHVLNEDPKTVQRGLVTALRRWDKEVFAQYKDEALPVMERDYKAKLKMSQELSLERTIELATNGIQFVGEPWIRRIVLVPTYILRPWVLLTEYRDVGIYIYPVSDDSMGIDESVPPPQLVKLYKALGDANRLRLLKRLAAGSMTLREATDLLGSAKSTAYHHLAILRQAGLVWVREGEDKTYTLRDDLIPKASELLQGFLQPGSSTTPDNVRPLAPS
ncbi:MAG: ArsR/SmtB family transcription factor [Actinomycetota bacterium]